MSLRQWARVIKRDAFAVCIAARDPRVPWYVKLMAAAIAAYAFSPIDLIPDVIPVLGLLDEVILLPLAIRVVVRLIPVPLMAEFRDEAERRAARPFSKLGAVFIVAIWGGTVTLTVWLLAR